MKLYFVIAVLFAFVNGSLPPNIFNPKCPRKGAQTVPCIIRGINRFKPYLKQGLEDMNIPRMEPFKMRSLDLLADVPSMSLRGEASNIVAYGCSNYQVRGLRLDMDKLHMEMIVYVPKLTVSADYDSTGSTLLGTDISGSGQFHGTLTGVTATIRTWGKSVWRNKQEFSKLENVEMEITFDDGQIHVDPDIKSITSKSAAAFINANTGLIMKSMAPLINKASGPVLQTYLSKVFNALPLREIFQT